MEIEQFKAEFESKCAHGFVIKLRNLNKGGILRMLAETPGDSEMRVEVAERKRTIVNTVED
jgi:hypothetical protein